jgi:hypothetical protein
MWNLVWPDKIVMVGEDGEELELGQIDYDPDLDSEGEIEEVRETDEDNPDVYLLWE